MNQIQSGYQKISLRFNLFKTLDNCRLCEGSFYAETLKLKDTPAANELYFTKIEALEARKFPLEVVMCSNCNHIQLKHIVSPERLFSNYIYKSGTSKFFKNHFEELANTISSLQIGNQYVLEVGSNDGTLLEALKKRNIASIGIEPSSLLTKECIANKLIVYESFLDKKITDTILIEHGKAAIVVGNNVFAHIEEMKNAFECVFNLLDEKGIFIFEVAHFQNILTDGIFDTIYHEHMSYHTVVALKPFLEGIGLRLVKVEKISTHGGSLRIYADKNSFRTIDESVDRIIVEEKKLGLNRPETFKAIENNISKTKNSISKINKQISSSKDQALFGYGAPAKVVTFLFQTEAECLDLIGIIDDNIQKQNMFLPGIGVEILSSSRMHGILKQLDNSEGIVSNCLIFPWNLKNEIIEELRKWFPLKIRAFWFFPVIQEVEL